MRDVPSLPPGVRIEAWPADSPPRPLADWRDAGREGQGIIWIDLETVTAWDEIADGLDSAGLPVYERAMLGHVLQGVGPTDHGAEGVPWYDAAVARRMGSPGSATFLRAFGLTSRIAPDPLDAPRVFEHPVFFLVSSRFLITNRVSGSGSDGQTRERCDPFPLDRLRDYVREHWARFANPEDLAILVLRTLVATYRPAFEDLEGRLQVLQQIFVQERLRPGSTGEDVFDEAAYRRALLQVTWAVDTFSRPVSELNRPATRPHTAWFPVHDAELPAIEVRELLGDATELLTRLRGEIRESFAFVAASEASEQLVISREARELSAATDARARRFETLVQFAGAAVLVPALVAQVLGALPAIYGDRSGLRAAFVVGATVLSGVLSVLALIAYRRRVARAGQAT
jgi:hypothetical protein